MTKPNQPCFIRRPLPADPKRVHLIGIAGSAMGAFGCMLQDQGYEVRGSDRNVYPPMSDILRARGIEWMDGFAAENLDWGPDLVVVGNICRRDNPEAVRMEAEGIASVSFPQAFSDLFLEDRTSVVIAGTHGKTTTTSLAAWLLAHAELDPGMLVGGVALNFDASYKLTGRSGAPYVVEGDEYDTAYFDKGPKFLHYRPQITVLNNIEFDHADIYDSLEEIIENFDRLMALMGPETLLLANLDDPLVMARAAKVAGRVVTYGFSEGAELRAVDVVPDAEGCAFTLVREGHDPVRVRSPMAGRHNVWNTLAAFGIGLELDVSVETLQAGLAGFVGVKKRQEERGEAAGVLVLDDYAHHPTAIGLTLDALRARYPNRRLWSIYEPKSNTARRNIHQAAYAEAFTHADRVVLARPFQKEDRFGADERLDLDRLVREVSAAGTPAVYRSGTDETLKYLLEELRAGDVVTFMSSSGFGGIHDRLLAALGAR